MIPEHRLNSELTLAQETETSRTYQLGAEDIQGMTDGLDALKQAIYKVLSTRQYEYPIYSFEYGIELESLIGQDPNYVKAELKRRIQECLLKDERIEAVDNFEFTIMKDELTCTFEVVSIFGELTVTKEVTI